MARYRVSIDIGGTFTDFVVVDETEERTSSGKVSSTSVSSSTGRPWA
jgi:N-methylhydantoinase A/oxoprolinase/acetone carboxylase beta subunit